MVPGVSAVNVIVPNVPVAVPAGEPATTPAAIPIGTSVVTPPLARARESPGSVVSVISSPTNEAFKPAIPSKAVESCAVVEIVEKSIVLVSRGTPPTVRSVPVTVVAWASSRVRTTEAPVAGPPGVTGPAMPTGTVVDWRVTS